MLTLNDFLNVSEWMVMNFKWFKYVKCDLNYSSNRIINSNQILLAHIRNNNSVSMNVNFYFHCRELMWSGYYKTDQMILKIITK